MNVEFLFVTIITKEMPKDILSSAKLLDGTEEVKKTENC